MGWNATLPFKTSLCPICTSFHSLSSKLFKNTHKLPLNLRTGWKDQTTKAVHNSRTYAHTPDAQVHLSSFCTSWSCNVSIESLKETKMLLRPFHLENTRETDRDFFVFHFLFWVSKLNGCWKICRNCSRLQECNRARWEHGAREEIGEGSSHFCLWQEHIREVKVRAVFCGYHQLQRFHKRLVESNSALQMSCVLAFPRTFAPHNMSMPSSYQAKFNRKRHPFDQITRFFSSIPYDDEILQDMRRRQSSGATAGGISSKCCFRGGWERGGLNPSTGWESSKWLALRCLVDSSGGTPRHLISQTA